MGRFYTIPFDNVTITVGQDAFEVLAGAGKPFWLHEVVIGQANEYGDAKAQGIRILLKKATGSYTTGSGGTTPTAQPHMTSDTAFGGTVKVNNTTQALAGSGALTTKRAEAFNAQAGYQYLPTPATMHFFAPAEAIVVSLEGETGTAAPIYSIVASGSMVVEELG